MKALFIGGTGTISMAITRLLAQMPQWELYLLNRGTRNEELPPGVKTIRADILKIDMHFLQEIREDRRSCVILSSIIRMAESLGMDIIAEGVETEEQLKTLIDMGCAFFQGYHFSRPIPAEEFEAKYTA